MKQKREAGSGFFLHFFDVVVVVVIIAVVIVIAKHLCKTCCRSQYLN